MTTRRIDLIVAGTFHPDAPAVRLDNAFRERQSQARAASLEAALAGGVFSQFTGLIELGEDHFLEIGVHAYARIADNRLYQGFGA